ncbi:MAG: class I adenylate-forming enzyme family protein [Planctomycetaceae bacterium]
MSTLLLPDALKLNGCWRAGHPAVITRSETLDWSELAARVDQVANGLLAAGCGAGERVGVIMDNEAATVEVLYGAMRAGAILAPLNTSVADDSLHAMLADAGVRAVFVSAPHRARLSEEKLGSVTLRVIAGADAVPAGWTDYTSWRQRQSDASPAFRLQPEKVCNVIYSSGTTGHPKGIAHTHQARMDWASDLAHALRYHSGARTLLSTGLFSNITWLGMLPTLLLGGTIVIQPRFDAGESLRLIGSERISHMGMVPVQYQRMLEHPGFGDADLSSVQMMMCCGAPLPAWIKARLFEVLPERIIELYGSTEGIITTLAPEEAAGRMASVGKPLPGEDLAILGTDDRPLRRGEAGEVVALSRFAMAGYWQNPKATDEAFWTDEAGRRWLRSGDIGKIDEAGYLYITDRKKDMIISGGQNVYPADLEAVLRSHPAVADCAVVGVPCERWGETPLGLVVLRGAGAVAHDELREWANARLGKQQRLAAIEFRDQLPRNANGKLLKRELRAKYWPAAT